MCSVFFLFVCLWVYLNILYLERWQPDREVLKFSLASEINISHCHPNHLDGATDLVKGRPRWNSALPSEGIRCVKDILIGCLHCVDSLDNCQASPSLCATQTWRLKMALGREMLGAEAVGRETETERPRGQGQGRGQHLESGIENKRH